MDKVLIGGNMRNGVIPYLPLDSLQPRPANPAPATTGSGTPGSGTVGRGAQ
jgi:hypothetical protein